MVSAAGAKIKNFGAHRCFTFSRFFFKKKKKKKGKLLLVLVGTLGRTLLPSVFVKGNCFTSAKTFVLGYTFCSTCVSAHHATIDSFIDVIFQKKRKVDDESVCPQNQIVLPNVFFFLFFFFFFLYFSSRPTINGSGLFLFGFIFIFSFDCCLP